MRTPAFLAWALEYSCSIRGQQDGSDPERTERQLRAGRAVGDARREGRVFEGLCLDPPYGFRIDDALLIYGGIHAVERACRGCPANAFSRPGDERLAGCFGLVPLPEDESVLHEAIERAIDERGLTASVAQRFEVTQPAWFGLWMHSPLSRTQAALLFDLLGNERLLNPLGRELIELRQGLAASLEQCLLIHVALYPAGLVEGRRWRLAPHCPRCKAPWYKPKSRQCGVCSYVGAPAPDRKRLARGRRPYFPLERLLGNAAAADLLFRYAAAQEQSLSPHLEQNRPPAVLRDIPPAD